MHKHILIVILITSCCTVLPQTNTPSKKMNAELMRELRLKMLAAPSEMDLKPTSEFPRVCGVLMDWPIDQGTVTVVSLSTGDASIYSTGTFGVFGGIGHATVRIAATNFVKLADKYYDQATPTNDYPYPKPGLVRFYLVGFNGVRTIEADLNSLRNGRDKYSDLYMQGQQVITEMRLVTQKQRGETP
jgi:hypothetical protein